MAFVVLVRPASWRWPAITALIGLALLGRRQLAWHFPTFAGIDGPSAGGSSVDFGDLQAVGAVASVAETLVVLAVVVACLVEVRDLLDRTGGSATEAAAGGPAEAQIGDGVFG